MICRILLALAIVAVFAGADELERTPRFLGLENLFGGGRSAAAAGRGPRPQIGHPGAVVRPRPRPIGHPGAVVRPGARPIGRPGAFVRPNARPPLVKPIQPQYFGSSMVKPGLIRRPLIKPGIAPPQRQRPAPGMFGNLFNWFG